MCLYNYQYDDVGYSGSHSAGNTSYSDAISKAKE